MSVRFSACWADAYCGPAASRNSSKQALRFIGLPPPLALFLRVYPPEGRRERGLRTGCGYASARKPTRARSGHCGRHRLAATVAGLARAFGCMGVAVDDLQIGDAPIGEQKRPGGLAMLAPHAVERHPVVDLRGLAQQLAGLAAAARLQALEHAHEIARRAPELPGDHAGGMPARLAVRARAPQIGVPAESIDRLSAHATGARAT